MSSRRRVAMTALGAVLFHLLHLWSARSADAAPVVIDGEVPVGGADHFFLDFDVPAGTKEIEVHHDSKTRANTLDWGLYDQDGYRGWGGGTGEPIVIGETAASRAYVPGPIKPGKWRLIVGKAKVVASPALYHVDITFRDAPTLPAVARGSYHVAAARKTELRYYAGDFHVHSRESTDAGATLEQDIALAKSRGLDFIEISDHNTITQLDFFDALQAKEPGFLIIPGIEYTTYAGHANAIGATKWVDHKIGQPGVTINGAADAVLAQGAIFSINHPVLDVKCIGCKWLHDIDLKKIGGVEIGTGSINEDGVFFWERAHAFWDAILDRGIKVPALGGSDDHLAGVAPPDSLDTPIGNPTTLVRARELSVAGILEGVRKGATVVKLESPADPMLELEAATTKGGGDAIGYPGDTLGVQAIVLRVKVSGRAAGEEHQLRLLKNGKPAGEDVDVKGDPFVFETVVAAPSTGEDRWRAEVVLEGRPRTVTSHIWLRFDPNGPRAEEPAAADSGCGLTRRQGNASAPVRPVPVAPIAALAFLGLALIRSRAGRR